MILLSANMLRVPVIESPVTFFHTTATSIPRIKLTCNFYPSSLLHSILKWQKTALPVANVMMAAAVGEYAGPLGSSDLSTNMVYPRIRS